MLSVTLHGARRKGLTLLELVVVVAILAALAGILVPLLPSLMHKTHAATGATNLSEIAKAVQLYASQRGDNYPNQLDSIVAGTKIASYVLNGNTYMPAFLTADKLIQGDVDALRGVGITTVAPMVESSATGAVNWSPTFNPYGVAPGTTPTTTLSTAVYAAFLDPTVAAAKLGTTLTGSAAAYAERFVVFGLGKFATICGQGIDEAPVWYNPSEGQDPDSKYARFALVFQTAGANGALSQAKFLGVVEFAEWGAMTKDDNLSYFYSLK
jgi:prepilin-type N-terminal cleavage/methylation domain-containing protein